MDKTNQALSGDISFDGLTPLQQFTCKEIHSGLKLADDVNADSGDHTSLAKMFVALVHDLSGGGV